VREEAILRVAQDARDEVTYNYAKHSLSKPTSTKQEPNDGIRFPPRATTTPPVRSSTSMAVGQVGHMRITAPDTTYEQMTDLRGNNICFQGADGTVLGRVSMKTVFDLEAWQKRSQSITSTHVDFQRLSEAAARFQQVDSRTIKLWYGENTIRNQHEFEAAVNDFMNGVRINNHFNVDVTLEGQERGRLGTLLFHLYPT
jgi:hypothetical protein